MMKNKKQKLPFIYRKRLKTGILLIIFAICYLVYVHYLVNYYAIRNLYFILMQFSILFFFAYSLEELGKLLKYVQKGISGENKVAKVINKIGYRYHRYIEINPVYGDYDGIVQTDSQLLVIEVKNYKELKSSKLSTITKGLAYKCAAMKDYLDDTLENNKYRFVEGIVVVINGNFPKKNYDKDVIGLDELEGYLSDYFK